MLLKKNIYNAKIKTIKGKIPDITNLATNASLNAKINDAKGVMPSITNLATTATRNVRIDKDKIEIPNITNLATNLATDYNTNISEIENKISDHDHNKSITTPELNKLTAKCHTARLKQKKLARKSNTANFVKKD